MTMRAYFLKCRDRAGFNLVEAAIVLAVVGLVIGGIWVAAATVTENLRVSRTVQGVLTVIEGIRRLNNGRQPSALVGMGYSEGLTETLDKAGIIPKDVFTECETGTCTGPWGSTSGFRVNAFANAVSSLVQPSSQGEYQLQLWVPSRSSCIKIGMALAGANLEKYRVNTIVNGNNDYYFWAGSITMNMTTVQARCAPTYVGGNSSFAIYFSQ